MRSKPNSSDSVRSLSRVGPGDQRCGAVVAKNDLLTGPVHMSQLRGRLPVR